MRTYVALAALALTACGTAPRPVALGNAGFEPPEATRATVAPAHDHATHVHAHAEAPRPKATPAARPTSRIATTGRFRTPEAAMRYLARAYNRHDDAALRHVTTPGARDAMLSMRPYAPDLRFRSCTDAGDGRFLCDFTHANVAPATGRGTAQVTVSPAAKPGWYMSGLVDCGDD